MIRRTRVEVDLSAIVANARLVRQRVHGAKLFAVVKADGYGHGAVAVAGALSAARAADGFAVSLVEEGVALRDAGITAPVLVMGPSQVGGEDEIVAAGLTPVVASEEDLGALAHVVAKRGGGPVDAHLKVDTGMNRLGVPVERTGELAAEAARGGIRVVGLMTHFACADSDDPADPSSMTRRQLVRFAEAERAAIAAGAPLELRHAANSAGALLFPEARFDLVRSGIALYGTGSWLGGGREQAMRLVTEVAQLRTVAFGDTVGYGATWRAERASQVAVLPIGYADGLPRRATGHAQVAIRGHRVPLVGLISMDIAIADVTDLGGTVAVGDPAVLLGRASGGVAITAADYGRWAGLSEYEVTCGMSKRVPRTYVGDVR
jgi:alanine racemase